jgi:hypothetical protein
MFKTTTAAAALFAATLVGSTQANATFSAVWLYGTCSRGSAMPEGGFQENAYDALKTSGVMDAHSLCLNYFRAIVETENLVHRDRPWICGPADLNAMINQYLAKRLSWKRQFDMPTAADMQNSPGATEDVLQFLLTEYPCAR